MPAETIDPPAQSPFSAALDKVFAPVAELPPKKKEPAAESPKKEEPKPPAPKSGTPKELFAKPEGKKDEVVAPKSAIDEIAEPVKMDAKGKAGWEALKAAAKSSEIKAAELERKIADAKAAGKDTETLEARLASQEAKLTEYDAIVTRARLDDHPEFRREFIEGREKEIDKAAQVLEEISDEKGDIAAALALKGKARSKAIGELGEMDHMQAVRLDRLLEKIDDLDERAAAKREQAQESYKELQEQTRQKETASRSDLVKRKHLEFEDTSRSLRGELEVLNRAEGYDDWNARGESILKAAQAAVESNPNTNIRAEIEARAMPVYRQMFIEANAKVSEHEAKIAELEKELKAIHGKSPSLSSRSRNGAAEGDAKRPFSAALDRALGGGE